MAVSGVAVEGAPVPRPTIFVGSSTEGYGIAQAVQVNLDGVCEVKLWTQGVFGLTKGTLESLVKVVDEFDFAVLVLTADDLTISRGAAKPAARDNVLFELGLFIGALGRDRTFIIHSRADPLALPSDLAGVSTATFEPHADGNLEAALGAACAKIQYAIERLGTREGKGGRNGHGTVQQAAGCFRGLRDRSEVVNFEAVSGVVAGVPADAEAWIVVQVGSDATYWPQRRLSLSRAGSFNSVAQFGPRDSAGHGEGYVLLLIMAPPDVSARFREFRDTDASKGIPDLPPDAVPLDQVTVTRRRSGR
jgi:hypothetical protein